MEMNAELAEEFLTHGVPKDITREALEKIYPGAMDHIKACLKLIGDDPEREGLKDTPYRVVKSWLELYGGYKTNPVLDTSFADDIGDKDDSQIILCKDIKFYSTCEHHMIPFHGICHIGYLPGKKVIGVSKLGRIVEYYARRLQIQEKLCSQIADAVEKIIEPQGCGVIIDAQHMCMTARGIKNQNANMVTSQMRGKFRTQPQTRMEFMNLITMKFM